MPVYRKDRRLTRFVNVLRGLSMGVEAYTIAHSSAGICALYTMIGVDEGAVNLGDIFSKWPEFSGDPAFPVSREGMQPIDAYDIQWDKWDKTTAYGLARRRLAGFVADTIKEQYM